MKRVKSWFVATRKPTDEVNGVLVKLEYSRHCMGYQLVARPAFRYPDASIDFVVGKYKAIVRRYQACRRPNKRVEAYALAELSRQLKLKGGLAWEAVVSCCAAHGLELNPDYALVENYWECKDAGRWMPPGPGTRRAIAAEVLVASALAARATTSRRSPFARALIEQEHNSGGEHS